MAFRHETDIEYFSRTYLESFTTQELRTVASQLAVDLPVGLSSRMLIIGEILDAVDDALPVRGEDDTEYH